MNWFDNAIRISLGICKYYQGWSESKHVCQGEINLVKVYRIIDFRTFTSTLQRQSGELDSVIAAHVQSKAEQYNAHHGHEDISQHLGVIICRLVLLTLLKQRTLDAVEPRIIGGCHACYYVIPHLHVINKLLAF